MKNFICLLPLLILTPSAFGSGNPRPLDSNGSMPRPFYFEVTAGSEEKQGVLKLSRVENKGIRYSSQAIRLSAPLDKEKSASLFSFDGLSDTYNLGVEYYGGKSGFNPLTYATEQLRYCNEAGISGVCDSDALEKELGKDEATRIDREINLLFDKPSWEYGVSLTTGVKNYSFFTTDNTTDKQHEQSFSLEGVLGWRWTNRALTLSLAREKRYQEADEKTLCSSVDDNFLECKTAPGTSPRGKYSSVLGFSFKQWRNNHGFAFRLKHNNTTSTTGIEVPIYFVPDSANQWGGGVKFSWDDDSKDVNAAFFIGLGW